MAVINSPISEWSIRSCELTDLPRILLLEGAAYPHPWTQEQFMHELQADHAQIDLLLSRDEVAGYLCYWLLASELHILNLVTAPGFRRRGVAHRLLKYAFTQAHRMRAERAYLEVRAGNLGAISLYHKFGFNDDSIRRGYYRDGEDALLMSCPLASPINDGDLSS